MADMIPFPRLLGNDVPKSASLAAKVVGRITAQSWVRNPCANGMPGHPPCRSVAELEAMLRARADTTAAREGV